MLKIIAHELSTLRKDSRHLQAKETKKGSLQYSKKKI